jgi:Holliday junction resolvasome RuvABC DNA-binding subunit
MIGSSGTIGSHGEDFVILDVHGVGYLVHCSARTLHALPPAGEAVELAIETRVREDQIRLFGFTTATEREWFRLLQTVQGVGTKVALAVLSDDAITGKRTAFRNGRRKMFKLVHNLGWPRCARSPAPPRRSRMR